MNVIEVRHSNVEVEFSADMSKFSVKKLQTLKVQSVLYVAVIMTPEH